jgi:hypothetical protein
MWDEPLTPHCVGCSQSRPVMYRETLHATFRCVGVFFCGKVGAHHGADGETHLVSSVSETASAGVSWYLLAR